MPHNNNTSATIMLIGFSDRQHALFSQLFKQPDYQGFELVEFGHVDIAILDLDAANSDQHWAEFRKTYRETPVINVSLNPQQHPHWLAKPINTEALKALLMELSAKSEHAISATSTTTNHHRQTAHTADALKDNSNLLITSRCSASDLSFHEKAGKESYKIEEYFEGKFKQAVISCTQSKTPLQLIGHLHGEKLPGYLYLIPGRNVVITNLKNHLLRALSMVNLSTKHSRLEFAPFTEAVPDADTLMHWNTLLWQISLWTSRGRLQHDILSQQPLHLSQWPNFTQLSEFPHALRLAACLSQHSCIPSEIAQKLNIPLPYVYSFLSAANSLNLLVQQEQQRSHPHKPPKTAVRNMLQRMLRRLTTE